MPGEYKFGDKIGSEDIMIPSLPALGVDEKTLERLAVQMAEDAIASGSPGNNPRQARMKLWSCIDWLTLNKRTGGG